MVSVVVMASPCFMFEKVENYEVYSFLIFYAYPVSFVIENRWFLWKIFISHI